MEQEELDVTLEISIHIKKLTVPRKRVGKRTFLVSIVPPNQAHHFGIFEGGRLKLVPTT